MKKKKLSTMIGIVGIGLGTIALAACSNNQVNNVKNEKSSKQTAQKSVTSSSKKESNINNDEWMMMGYVAYRAKDSNDLSATRNSANSYTFSNDYGSVDVKVENDKVVVSNDGTSTFSKDKLEDSFNGDMKTIQKLAKNISTSSNFKSVSESDSETGSWKSGIPAEIVGEYSDENTGWNQIGKPLGIRFETLQDEHAQHREKERHGGNQQSRLLEVPQKSETIALVGILTD